MQVGILSLEESEDAFAYVAACLHAERKKDMHRAGVFSLVALAAGTGATQAQLVEVTITADNYYADNGGVLTCIGGNELGRDGNPA